MPETRNDTSASVHPELLRRYRWARDAWRKNPGVRAAAHTLGMDEREYCDRFVAEYGPITWTSSSTDSPLIWNPDDAYFQAGEMDGA